MSRDSRPSCLANMPEHSLTDTEILTFIGLLSGAETVDDDENDTKSASHKSKSVAPPLEPLKTAASSSTSGGAPRQRRQAGLAT